ncbi:hypothetical protein PGT21_029651 [Puccinia graminis f. sp. tritici]|uniref:Uncharacterized protein n=1 Tax=Puccinia graminis f. sp. tritici TaxID=56615 RepID=A0A5B0LS02_PUCGR|nr:hypothetical protein PGT21_029651 [Puccinia graminis f. sp. tritici]
MNSVIQGPKAVDTTDSHNGVIGVTEVAASRHGTASPHLRPRRVEFYNEVTTKVGGMAPFYSSRAAG